MSSIKTRKIILNVGGWVISIFFLLWPALINRAPILFADSVDYFRGLLGLDTFHRAPGYILLLRLNEWVGLGIWGVVLVQALIITFAVGYLQKRVGKAKHISEAWKIVCPLAILSSLPWFTSLILADFFVPLAGLALYLILFEWKKLKIAEKIMCMTVLIFSASTHLSIPPVVVGTAVIALVFFKKARKAYPGFLALVGLFLFVFLSIPLMRGVMLGNWYYSKAGGSFLAARLSQDGILGDYLDEICQQDPAKSPLCDFPVSTRRLGSEDFLWHNTHPYLLRYGWEGSNNEFRRVALHSILASPFKFVGTSLRNLSMMMMELGNYDFLYEPFPFLDEYILKATPAEYPIYRDSLEKKNLLVPVHEAFHWARRIIFILIIAGTFFWIIRGKGGRDEQIFFLFVSLYCLANATLPAFVVGPFARYAERANWLMLFGAYIVFRSELRKMGRFVPRAVRSFTSQ